MALVRLSVPSAIAAFSAVSVTVGAARGVFRFASWPS
jgi:hypothetical protein